MYVSALNAYPKSNDVTSITDLGIYCVITKSGPPVYLLEDQQLLCLTDNQVIEYKKPSEIKPGYYILSKEENMLGNKATAVGRMAGIKFNAGTKVSNTIFSFDVSNTRSHFEVAAFIRNYLRIAEAKFEFGRTNEKVAVVFKSDEDGKCIDGVKLTKDFLDINGLGVIKGILETSSIEVNKRLVKITVKSARVRKMLQILMMRAGVYCRKKNAVTVICGISKSKQFIKALCNTYRISKKKLPTDAFIPPLIKVCNKPKWVRKSTLLRLGVDPEYLNKYYYQVVEVEKREETSGVYIWDTPVDNINGYIVYAGD